MANRVFIGFLLLLLLTLILWGSVWFMQNFARHSEEIRSGFSTEARRNPLLAAERFLQRLGMQVESLSGREYLLSPPAEPGVLLVRDLGPSLPREREEKLLAWIAAGSHLILALGRIPTEDEPNNHLLEYLGISLIELDQEEQSEGTEPVEVVLPGGIEPILVAFDRSRSLLADEVATDWQVSAENGYHLLRLNYRQGAITLLSDNGFLTNSEIDEQDHALLLAHLVEGEQKGWLLYSSQMPSLLQLVWRHAPYLFISSCLILLVSVWWLTRRSGPILNQANPDRRDLLEHLQAAAEFLWQQDKARTLQQRTRQQVEKRWLQSHPILERFDQDARCDWLAERTGFSGQSIHQALYTDQTQERMLIRSSASLQRLMTALHPEKKMEQLNGRFRKK